MIYTTIIRLIAIPILIILFVDSAADADRTDSSLSSTYKQLSPSQKTDSTQSNPPMTSMSGCVTYNHTMDGRGLKSSNEEPEAQIEFLDLSQILDASKHEIEQINRDINTSDEFKPFREDLQIKKRGSELPTSGPPPADSDCQTFSWDVKLFENKLAALETKLDRFLSKFQVK